MPLSSLVLIIAGLADLLITWLIVCCCCLRSALSKQKAMQRDRWGALAPEDALISEPEKESSDVDDQDDDGRTGDASPSSQQDKGNTFRNPLAATLRNKEEEDEEPAAAVEGTS
ncbi:uncharacterized protein LOC142803368 [Rhipicephalus microplus]|uniref:uncharacterized protein LOC142803368 n=1 Tax=Rhipicephalus microplus TaxID=6941 RepID=UPI003F6BD0CF